ncbi:MAG: L-threonylcarbamoyladenylate synthase [Acidimicrobiales bacterium]
MAESTFESAVDLAAVARAVDCLRAGGLVAMPTETVYGLAADAINDAAVRSIFTTKGRPAGHPLIVHIAAASELPDWTTSDDPRVWLLAAAFWPGPLTMVLPRSDKVSAVAVGNRETVAVRVPNHPVALELLRQFGGGVAAPSANRFGRVSPTTAAHVKADLGDDVGVILDGGPCGVGVESTIVELVGGSVTLLRPGGVSVEQLEAVLGAPVVDGTAGAARASGMMASHYAPAASVRVAEADQLTLVSDDAAVIVPFATDRPRSWSLPADTAGFAAGLYAALRAADQAAVRDCGGLAKPGAIACCAHRPGRQSGRAPPLTPPA